MKVESGHKMFYWFHTFQSTKGKNTSATGYEYDSGLAFG